MLFQGAAMGILLTVLLELSAGGVVEILQVPEASLVLVGLATPITTVYGILFFLVCFAWVRHKEKNERLLAENRK